MSKCLINQSCEEQTPFPIRVDQTITCAAVCESTGRKCRNCPRKWLPIASLVLKMKGKCGVNCYLCNVHYNAALKVLGKSFPWLLDQAIGSTLNYDEYWALAGNTELDLNKTIVSNSSIPSEVTNAVVHNATWWKNQLLKKKKNHRK
jgi:hypothetical protein